MGRGNVIKRDRERLKAQRRQERVARRLSPRAPQTPSEARSKSHVPVERLEGHNEPRHPLEVS